MKNTVVGIMAHVDAGKTTLSEGLLYSAGALDKIGRVDKRDAFLDTHSLERERGITIFSKQAIFEYGDMRVTLIDTPGHIDFSCETERALSVQDYAILVVSATDGVSAHTKTLWHLLAARSVPTFIFVNKTDISERKRDAVMGELSAVLSSGCVDFSSDGEDAFFESCAALDEELMAEYFESGELSVDSIASAIAERKIFPCFFGSALKMKGVGEFLRGFAKYNKEKKYSGALFGARVYKISRDKQGKRLTYLKLTAGSLKTKDTVSVRLRSGEVVEEKIEEIRLYSGDKYKSVGAVTAGEVCCVLGPSQTQAGMGLGIEPSEEATLSPVLDYRMILPREANPYETYMRLMELVEEDPALALSYEARTHEIRIRLMGEIQIEVLKRIIRERFGLAVEFDEGAILYKETVAESVMGAGHFEPLRHYSEVHLRIDPMPEGTGIIAASECPTDTLSLNWQRLVLTHIEEKSHRGVLTGAPLTDVKITLVAGKAHQKHTEGGDFRQATYRAIRQGLMKSVAVLLEPTFDFRIELPSEYLGRAMNDITNMRGVSDPPDIVDGIAVLEGNCPVLTMRSYSTELRAYTRGEGKISLTVGPYAPAHNAAEVISRAEYDPVLDERNTPNSVFCKGGSGYVVPWDEADALMHVSPTGAYVSDGGADAEENAPRKVDFKEREASEEELVRIFESTYGKIKKRTYSEKTENAAKNYENPERPRKQKPKGEPYVIVDGYNFLFAIDELRRAAESDLARARDVLVRMACDYSAFHKCRSIVVFDAYKRKDAAGSEEICGPVRVVYTKSNETADSYIEKTTHALAEGHTVRVVSSDLQEQLMILGCGGLRVSAREFYAEIRSTASLIRETAESYFK